MSLLDRYSREARLAPGLLVLLPLAVAVAAAFPEARELDGALIVTLATVAGAVFLADLVRTQGRAAEQMLFRRWGGAPTTRMLRYRQAADIAAVHSLHERVEAATGVTLPGPEAERDDRIAADSCYREAVAILRGRTRDAERFPIVYNENIGYGRKRNTWAVRASGRLTAAGALLTGVLLIAVDGEIEPWIAVSLGSGALLLWFWFKAVTEKGVLDAGELYAEALFDAARRLQSQSPNS